ncbi:MAG: type II secretion system protein [Mariprofundaceae bacterium]|nr:type II secretion system protein [Mariprofundaceae bacterium]
MNRVLNRGFTLLELMVALSVFALIASVCYAALVPAGEGFRMLQAERDQLESSYQMDRRLRMDVSYLLHSSDKALRTLEITHDQRGGDAFDGLNLLVSDASSLVPMLIHYSLDEDSGNIVRSSAAAWSRDAQPVRWQMQKAVSFEVQALAADGRWLDVWDKVRGDTLPQALRVRWQGEGSLVRELILPLFIAGGGG